jgi:hypothetical protein
MDGLSVWAAAWLHGTVAVPVLDEARRAWWPASRAWRVALVALAAPLVVAAVLVDERDKVMRGVVALAGSFYALRAFQTVWEPRFACEPLLRRQVIPRRPPTGPRRTRSGRGHEETD